MTDPADMPDFDQWLEHVLATMRMCHAIHIPWRPRRAVDVLDHRCLLQLDHDGRHVCASCGHRWREMSARTIRWGMRAAVALPFAFLAFEVTYGSLRGWPWPQVVVTPLIALGAVASAANYRRWSRRQRR